MNPKHLTLSLLFTFLIFGSSAAMAQDQNVITVKRDTLTWLDKSRSRPVPVAIYHAVAPSKKFRQIVVLNPGFPGKNTDYAFIANELARQGYLVMTVQHNLPSDPEMPVGENLYQRRLPFWETGVANVRFAVRKVKALYPQVNTRQLIVIGHSYGGDIAMLMATRYPGMVSKVISLDNRRMPFPRTGTPIIYSIRSKDLPADPGVLPSAKEQAQFGITVVKVNTNHEDMGGFGTPQQLEEINGLINGFLHKDQFALLQDTVRRIAAEAKGNFGVAVMDLTTKATLMLNADQRFPMQSVFKFPLAMYVLRMVDQKKLQLDKKIHFSKADLSIPYASPLRDKYPQGEVDIPLSEVLAATVSQSDNNGCDKLFELIGGTRVLNDYLHYIGIRNIAVVATEKQMGLSSDVQYTNWCHPSAMLDLLIKLQQGTELSKASNAFLWKLMVETTSAPFRIKGLLPVGTLVAHKPGTSGTTKDGFTATTNDVGIVEMPDHRRFAIVLYVSNSTADAKAREGAMAKITKVIYDRMLSLEYR